MSLKIKQFAYASDNFGYLVYGTAHAIAIDPGAVDHMTAFAMERGVTIDMVINTHSHHDHVVGNKEMIERTGAQFLPCEILKTKELLELEGKSILILSTPGHTDDGLSFKVDDFIITGDTLFNGTVGNCFSGDMKGFFNSIKLLTSFPGHTLVYAGHDYVMESMAFAKTIDPANTHIDLFLAKYNPENVVSTLSDELEINPYLRFNTPAMIALMESKKLPTGTEYERWCSIMEL